MLSHGIREQGVIGGRGERRGGGSAQGPGRALQVELRAQVAAPPREAQCHGSVRAADQETVARAGRGGGEERQIQADGGVLVQNHLLGRLGTQIIVANNQINNRLPL